MAKRWGPSFERGVVYQWRSGQEGQEGIFMALSAPPEEGGKAEAFLGLLGSNGLYTNGSFPKPTSFTLTSEALSKEFATNKAAAEAKYMEKWLAIEGPLADLDFHAVQGEMASVSLRLVGYKSNPKEFGLQVTCGLAAGQMGKAQGATRGQTIKVVGQCKGMWAGMFLTLAECEIVSAGPDPVIHLDLEQVAKEHAADATAVEKKYHGKEVQISGVLLELQQTGRGLAAIIAPGGPSKNKADVLKVSASYAVDVKPWFSKYKVGDPIKVKGQFAVIGEGMVGLNLCYPAP
jgi:hypothetical protein